MPVPNKPGYNSMPLILVDNPCLHQKMDMNHHQQQKEPQHYDSPTMAAATRKEGRLGRPRTTSGTTKKTVTFNLRVRARTSLHLNNYSASEIEACWYSDEETSAIRRNAKDLIAIFDQQEEQRLPSENPADDYDNSCRCLRGLENHLTKNAARRRKNRLMAIGIVLLEQATQRSQMLWDHERISCLYKIVTAEDAVKAQKVGIQDASCE